MTSPAPPSLRGVCRKTALNNYGVWSASPLTLALETKRRNQVTANPRNSFRAAIILFGFVTEHRRAAAPRRGGAEANQSQLALLQTRAAN